MTKLTLGTHPFLLGFEQLERLVERTAKSGNDGYPPYNIEQTSETSYRITLAVAGFAEEELAITVEDSSLVIRGRQIEDLEGRVFLHRGIAARQFQRSFVLAPFLPSTMPKANSWRWWRTARWRSSLPARMTCVPTLSTDRTIQKQRAAVEGSPMKFN